jgi:hypothetical protein
MLVANQGFQMVVYFQTKNPIWVNLSGLWNGRWSYTLWPFGLSYAIWYFGGPFGIFYGHLIYFFPFWYYICIMKNLATLLPTCSSFFSSFLRVFSKPHSLKAYTKNHQQNIALHPVFFFCFKVFSKPHSLEAFMKTFGTFFTKHN